MFNAIIFRRFVLLAAFPEIHDRYADIIFIVQWAVLPVVLQYTALDHYRRSTQYS